MPKKPIAYRGGEPFVFVSYAHADAELAYPIISGLQERGLRVWFDDGLDVGDIWEEVLADHVEQCAAMLCLVSTRFTDSNNCLDEIYYAKEKKRELLILHLEDEVLPRNFQFRYGRFHALRLSAYSDRSALLDKLSTTPKLRCCIGQVQGGTRELEENPEALYQKGRECYEAKSYKDAVKWFRKAAGWGHPAAMNNLGDCYYWAKGVSQSYEEAVMCYRLGADKGDAAAMNGCGNCYYWGNSVDQSYEKAVAWYRRAAEKGNADAMGNLGYCYEYGHGVSQSHEEAVTWYRQAADMGKTKAMSKLANCYGTGLGVEKDVKQAEYWRNKKKLADA